MLIFLKLYLAHLITEFLLQPGSLTRKKRSLRDLSVHLLIYLAAALACLNFSLNARVAVTVLILCLVHGICDYVEAHLLRDNWLAFALDQSIHLVLIGLAAIWLRFGSFEVVITVARAGADSKTLHLYLSGYLITVFGGGFFVQSITKYFMQRIDPVVLPIKPGLPSAGRYIGWLERALVLTFLVTGYKEGVGLLLAAKTLVRYPEIKDDSKGHFAEYYLIGTLTSVGVSILVGLVLLKMSSMF